MKQRQHAGDAHARQRRTLDDGGECVRRRADFHVLDDLVENRRECGVELIPLLVCQREFQRPCGAKAPTAWPEHTENRRDAWRRRGNRLS
ncbi:hypothetical protein [Rhodothermus marinus]|uniref:hypothetical protein n=1 Tax=Rhodothermus marinus TaxID=29549 RepID=UPI0006D21FB7|nr:hypothetical protein [Rhodothermus marinus]